MKNSVLGVLGALIAVAGVIWTLQGLGLIGGSVMSGKTVWAIIGPLVAIAGAAMMVAGMRGRRRSAR
jgi:hypothetical protein